MFATMITKNLPVEVKEVNFSRFSTAQYDKFSYVTKIEVNFNAVALEKKIIDNRLKVQIKILFMNNV